MSWLFMVPGSCDPAVPAFPPLFDFDFHDNAYMSYVNAWNYLQPRGITEGWIIGECYNPVLWLAQWTLQRGGGDVAPPLSFDS